MKRRHNSADDAADLAPDSSPRSSRTRSGDVLAGSLTAAFGAAVIVFVQGFPTLPGGYPGPALFPGIIGGLMVVFGLALVLQSARRRGTSPDADEASEPRPTSWRGAASNALAVLLGIVIYLLVVELLGFLLTMAALLFLLMLKLKTRAVVAVPASIAATLLIYAFFRGLLLVPLPPGILG